MASPDFTPEGIKIQTYQEVFDELAAGYKAIYGSDINTDPNSSGGQRIGIEAKSNQDMQAFTVALYNQLDVDLSQGDGLDRRIKLAGISRRSGTQSNWDLQLTSNAAFNTTADYTIKDQNGNQWSPEESVTIEVGTQTVTFKAVQFGAVPGTVGTTFTQVTNEPNITAIVASVDAVTGSDEETDAELRVRRRKSVQNPSRSTVGKMYAALANLSGVTDLQVYENDTDSTDSKGVPSHSIWVVVEGGTVADVAETMTYNKTSGTGMKGVVSEDYAETFVRPDGSSMVITHTMKFDRPTYVPVHVRMTATGKPGVSTGEIDDQLIKTQVSASAYLINDDIDASQLYAPAYTAGNNFYLTDLEISLDGVTWTNTDLLSEPNQKFTVATDDIIVTKVGG